MEMVAVCGQKESVRDRVVKVILKQADPENRGNLRASEVDDNACLEELFDSLGVIEIIGEFEEEFNMGIPPVIADQLETVGDAVKWIEYLQAHPDEY